ncbi:MAG: metallophosphoesterase, partial [Thermoplasmata archaeon]|nr:metallophosphoesterase [Thermoplasmata archaeon]
MSIARTIPVIFLILCLLASSAVAQKSKTFVLVADTHFGNVHEGNGSADDIASMEDWINGTDPDFLMHMGDIVSYSKKAGADDQGDYDEFIEAGASFDEMIEHTPINDVWFALGNHEAYPNTDTKYSKWAHWDGARFMRDRGLVSPWYVIKEGNNVFVFVGVVRDMENGWVSEWKDIGWGKNEGSIYIPQNKLEWLDRTLAYWKDTPNNIFVICHMAIVDTNSYSRAWYHQSHNQWIMTSRKLLSIFEDNRVDVYLHGHIHTDPDSSYSSHVNVSKGNVLVSGFRSDLPATTFIHVPSINWEHGKERNKRSNYPALMTFDLVEDQVYFEL